MSIGYRIVVYEANIKSYPFDFPPLIAKVRYFDTWEKICMKSKQMEFLLKLRQTKFHILLFPTIVFKRGFCRDSSCINIIHVHGCISKGLNKGIHLGQIFRCLLSCSSRMGHSPAPRSCLTLELATTSTTLSLLLLLNMNHCTPILSHLW